MGQGSESGSSARPCREPVLPEIVVGDAVTSRIHHASAMLPHASPTMEIIWPAWNNQKSRPRPKPLAMPFKRCDIVFLVRFPAAAHAHQTISEDSALHRF